MSKPVPETRLVNGNIEKRCPKCNEFKSLTEFGEKITRYLGRRSQCRECERAYCREYSKVIHRSYKKDYYENNKERILQQQKEYYENNKEKVIQRTKKYSIKSKFNLTKEEYDELCKNGCNACSSYEVLCVDHDHISNEVRGILCNKCNTALGLLNDDSTKILKLAEYIENWNRKYALK